MAINYSPYFRLTQITAVEISGSELHCSNNCQKIMLTECPADTSATENCTADESTLVVFLREEAMSMLWYYETKSVIQVQRLYHREYGAQEPGTFYQAIAGTVS
jgi:hypothetical protein